MTTKTNVKLTKTDYVGFLNDVATIKVKNKRSKLAKVVEMASMFVDDYNEDKKGTTLSELEENVGKVLSLSADLPQEVYESVKNMYDAILVEASLRKPVERKSRITKKDKKEAPKKEEEVVEEPPTNTVEHTLTHELTITSIDGEQSKFVPISFNTIEEMAKHFDEGETYDLYVLSYWGEDFDKEDYDVLGITGDEPIILNNGYDLMSIVHVGKKSAIAVSQYNDVNTTITQDDLKDMLSQQMGLFKKLEEDEEEEE